MLRDEYEIDNLSMSIQTLTSETDLELTAIVRLLGDGELYQMVRRDLERRRRLTKQTRRPSPTGKQGFGTRAGKDVAFAQLVQQTKDDP